MKMVEINRQCSGESATLLKGTELTKLCGQNQSTTLGWIRYSPEENWIGRVIWSESIGNAVVNLLLSWRELNWPSYVVRINRNARVNPLLSWRELNWPNYMVRINRQCWGESATLLKGTELAALYGQNQSTMLGWICYFPEVNGISRVIWSESIGNARLNLLLSWRERIWTGCDDRAQKINSINLSIDQDLGVWFTSKSLHSRSILR